jgi:large subunit ribosomal protein L10
MPRPEKVQAVADIKERLENARAVFVAEYAGLSVKQQQALRRGLRGSHAEFKVVKMTLARRAASELGYEELADLLVGPSGLAFADDDAVTAAKALKDFAGDNAQLVIKGGLLGGQVLSPERVSELAELEPREVQLAKIAGALKAPLANMAGLLAAMPRNLASMLQQLVEKKESGEVPAAEPEAAAPPAAEAPAEEPAADAEEAAPEAATEEAEPEAAADDAAAEAAADDAAPEAVADEAAAEEASAETTDDATDTETETTADEAEEE